MYQYNHCRVLFHAPTIQTHREQLGEFVREYTEEQCPICGCDSFETVSDCPKCGQSMASGSTLCGSCRQDLLRRFTAFADTLTAEEEAQLDDWLDGDTITNRRNWT